MCAIEIRSFSKTAGFTGTRCAFTVVPKELKGAAGDGSEVALHGLWNRRQSTKFNGVSYQVQRAAEAVYREEGQKDVKVVLFVTVGYVYLVPFALLGAAGEGYFRVSSFNSRANVEEAMKRVAAMKW